ncbi:MAG: hypothetical protein RJA76_167 [Bacteroidota bacterium]|jgi:hypothetical protein
MKKNLISSFFFLLSSYFLLISSIVFGQGKSFSISAEALKNKIKGGWAGQTIGVTYGGPVEFRYNGTMINKYHPIPWYPGYLKQTMVNNPGLYDDLYMDITFVEVMDREGLGAPMSSHAKAYAKAGYALWHANQAGRYNLLNGMDAPASGHWLNNPHADCIDYQIECDFAGLMSPGMPNAASEISNKIGHIMNYGDGYYGGVFLGACYTQAFIYNDISKVVQEALKTIPKQSRYYQCIADVIKWHRQYPTDWTKTWLEVQKKYTDDIGCPDGVYAPFNIDATVNSAYVVMGLLYGNGDFTKTIDVATHCGQDADCNPSSAAGILGVMVGYDKIPLYWKQGLKEAEDIDFKYTSTSLNKVYQLSFQQALKNIENHGGKVNGNTIQIPLETIKTVPYEESFVGLSPKEKLNLGKVLTAEEEFSFNGVGFVVRGEASKWGVLLSDYFEMEVWVDGALFEKVKLPVSFTTRRHELTWNYQLKPGDHKVKLKLLNQVPGFECKLQDVIVYKNR